MSFWGKDKTMIAKHSLRAIHEIGLMAGISIILTANANGQSIHPPIGTLLSDPPQVVTSFELQAINDPATGKGAFVFEGHRVPPVVRAVPGGAIRVEYVNQMSKSSSEVCVDGPCMNMTNLHFHGLHVSPNAPGDDVLTMVAMPGESLHYTVDIPCGSASRIVLVSPTSSWRELSAESRWNVGRNRNRRNGSVLSRDQDYEGEDSNPSRR